MLLGLEQRASGGDQARGARGAAPTTPTSRRRAPTPSGGRSTSPPNGRCVVAELRRIKARHVIVGTVPSVTIAPIARGVGGKVRPGSRYFPYYTRPWIRDEDFDPDSDPHITEDEARAVDSAIDAYNQTIIDSVAAAREDGLDWYLFDLGGLLDRLASKRYLVRPCSAAGLVDALSAAARACEPRSGAEHEVLRLRTRRTHRRRALLTRRDPSDDDRLRGDRARGDPDHEPGAGRVPDSNRASRGRDQARSTSHACSPRTR